MESEIKYCRLVNSGRLNDRFLTIQVKSSSEPEKSNMGKLYCLIEITKPWNSSYQIGQSIINTLTREYYKGDSTSILVNFEKALKKVNENLSYITQNGETEWIGSLNGILSLILDDQIHIATTGKVYACLLRNNKVTNISESEGEPPHPLQTFGEITSGSLEKKDTILIGSSKLFNYLPLENLHSLLNDNPYNNTVKIAQILQRNKVKNLNLIILQNLASSEQQQPDTIYIDQQKSQFFINLQHQAGELIKSIKETWQNKIHPKIKNGLEKSKILKQSKELSAKTFHGLKKQIDHHKENILSKLKKPELEIEDKTPYNIYHYTQKNSAHSANIFGNFGKSLVNNKILENTKNMFSVFLHWLLAKKNRSLAYMGIIAVLVIILVANVGILRQKQDSKNKEIASQNTISLIKENYSQATLALNYNKEQAKTLFAQIINDSQNIKNNSEIENIAKTSQQKLDELTLTARYDAPKLIANFSDSSLLFFFQNKFITVGKNDGKIYYIDLSDNQVSQHSSLPKSSGNIQTGFSLDDSSNNPYFYTSKNQLFALKDPILAPDQVSPKDGQWENTASIASFSDNLYFLDPTTGQIYKHIKDSDGYRQGEEYLNSAEVDIKNGISMTIDGAVYVLNKDGTAIKLIKGKEQNFALKDIPTPNNKISQPKLIKTSSTDDYLYILDGNRIIEFDKTGKFIKQLAFSQDIKNVQDFIIDKDNKKIYVLSENKLYSSGELTS
jgi:hypothetical protein